MSLSKYNKGGVKWSVEIPEDCGFTKLDNDNIKGIVKGFFPNNKGKFGTQYVMIALLDGQKEISLVDLPKHMNEVCSEICEDSEAIEEINNNLCRFHTEKYYSKKYSKECYGIVFDD